MLLLPRFNKKQNGFPFDGTIGATYWGNFARAIMNRFPNERAHYFDGSRVLIERYAEITTRGITSGLGSYGESLGYRLGHSIRSRSHEGNFWPGNRVEAGRIDGAARAAHIIDNLERDDDGNITEAITIFTHSYGTAYSRGLVESLIKYANDNDIKGLNIQFQVDIASFQGNSLPANVANTFQVGSWGDLVAGTAPIPGATRIDGSTKLIPGHGLGDYSADRIIDNIINFARENNINITVDGVKQ